MPDRPPLPWDELQVLSDEAVLALARERRGGGAGDRETVDRCAVLLLTRHRTTIRALCARKAPTHAVDDIQGDVRERLAGVLRGGEPVANVGGLITTLCKFAVADWHEAAKRRPVPAEGGGEEAAADAGYGEVEVRELVQELLAGLPERSRRAVEATYLEDRPAGDVARELGVTTNNLYQIVHRALAEMRKGGDVSRVEELFGRFVAEHEAGRDPDLVVFLDEAGGGRDELADMIAAYSIGHPRTTIPEAELEAELLLVRAAATPWSELLPRLRERAGLLRSDLVRRLADRLGFPAEEHRVGEYVHELETGLRSPRAVRPPVVRALADILGVAADVLARARLVEPPAAGPPLVFRRDASIQLEDGVVADAMMPAPPDALDDLFTGGDA